MNPGNMLRSKWPSDSNNHFATTRMRASMIWVASKRVEEIMTMDND
jgi:hypothetical protein